MRMGSSGGGRSMFGDGGSTEHRFNVTFSALGPQYPESPESRHAHRQPDVAVVRPVLLPSTPSAADPAAATTRRHITGAWILGPALFLTSGEIDVHARRGCARRSFTALMFVAARGQEAAVRELAPGRLLLAGRPRAQAAGQLHLGGFQGLRAGDRRQLSGPGARNHRTDSQDDRQADPLPVRHALARRPYRRQWRIRGGRRRDRVLRAVRRGIAHKGHERCPARRAGVDHFPGSHGLRRWHASRGAHPTGPGAQQGRRRGLPAQGADPGDGRSLRQLEVGQQRGRSGRGLRQLDSCAGRHGAVGHRTVVPGHGSLGGVRKRCARSAPTWRTCRRRCVRGQGRKVTPISW